MQLGKAGRAEAEVVEVEVVQGGGAEVEAVRADGRGRAAGAHVGGRLEKDHDGDTCKNWS